MTKRKRPRKTMHEVLVEQFDYMESSKSPEQGGLITKDVQLLRPAVERLYAKYGQPKKKG